MPGTPAIRVGVLLQAICLAALFLQLPGPATAHSLAFSNNATIYSPSRAAASRPDSSFNESARIQRESGTSTGDSPSGPFEAANDTNNSQKLNASNSHPDGAIVLADTSESEPFSDNFESKTRQSSNDPGPNITPLAIYFNDNHEFSQPLLYIFTVSQQSKVRISKIFENLPEAAAHTARADGAPFIFGENKVCFPASIRRPAVLQENRFPKRHAILDKWQRGRRSLQPRRG
jgi:hypothetical protein